jgi:hypothetical protein
VKNPALLTMSNYEIRPQIFVTARDVLVALTLTQSASW